MNFADRLKMKRTEQGISEEEMSACLSCPLEYFREIEKGQREPRIGEVVLAAQKLGVTTDYLLGTEENKKPFDPLKAIAGLGLPGGMILPESSGAEEDFDEELAKELAEMVSAIDTKRSERKGEKRE